MTEIGKVKYKGGKNHTHPARFGEGKTRMFHPHVWYTFYSDEDMEDFDFYQKKAELNPDIWEVQSTEMLKLIEMKDKAATMTKIQLKSLAKKLKIVVSSKDTKEDIRDKIEASE